MIEIEKYFYEELEKIAAGGTLSHFTNSASLGIINEFGGLVGTPRKEIEGYKGISFTRNPKVSTYIRNTPYPAGPIVEFVAPIDKLRQRHRIRSFSHPRYRNEFEEIVRTTPKIKGLRKKGYVASIIPLDRFSKIRVSIDQIKQLARPANVQDAYIQGGKRLKALAKILKTARKKKILVEFVKRL